MVSVPIGGVRVDLQLNSAAFIRDIAKSSSATAKAAGTMSKSLGGVQSSVASLNKTMLAWLTLRQIKQVVNFTEACLKLASTIKGPLGIAAREFTDKATAMSNSFKLGVAQGFMNAVQDGLKASGVSLEQLANAGVIVGNILGKIFTSIVNFLTHDIPEGVKVSINSLNSFINAYNALAAARDAAAAQPSALAPGAGTGLLAGGETGGRLPSIDTSGIESYVQSWTDVANVQGIVAGALQTTAQGQREATEAAEAFGRVVKANEAIYEATRTPLEEYDQALGKITQAHATGELAARATAQAQRELASSYLDAAQQVTGTLMQAFEGNKAIQIANAVVNAGAAMVRALTLPFPLNWAQVAAVGALAATQIAAIRSAKPGSGSNVKASGKGSSGVKSAGAASTAAAPATGTSTPGQAVNITLMGTGGFDREQVRALIEHINDAVGDGAQLRVAG